MPDYPQPSSAAATAKMKANRSKDTGPELRLRSHLHHQGYRYRVHFLVGVDERRPVSVDIAFPRLKLAIFIDGCFWHGCRLHRTVPVANASYWRPKLARNAERDRENTDRLTRAGWTVLRFWEHDDPVQAATSVAEMVACLPHGSNLSSQAS